MKTLFRKIFGYAIATSPLLGIFVYSLIMNWSLTIFICLGIVFVVVLFLFTLVIVDIGLRIVDGRSLK